MAGNRKSDPCRDATERNFGMTRRFLLLSLSLIFFPGMLALAQDPPSTPDKASASAAGQRQNKPAESDEAQTAALAKAAQNPVANLISFPLQNNTAFGIGPYKRTQNVLNIQLVIPFHLSKDVTMITRTILPVIWQPNGQPTQGRYGLGDLNRTCVLSRAKPSKWIG